MKTTGRRQPAAGRTTNTDAIVIGGGVNGLTCAAVLGKAGLQHAAAGAARCRRWLRRGATRSRRASACRRWRTDRPVRADVVEQLQFRGMAWGCRSADPFTALAPTGVRCRSSTMFGAGGGASGNGRRMTPRRGRSSRVTLARLGRVIGSLFTRTRPSIDDPGTDDLWTVMRTLRAFRALPKDDAWRLLRWGPMAVADLVERVPRDELLRAAVAADGLLGRDARAVVRGQRASAAARTKRMRRSASRAMRDVVGGPAAVAAALRRRGQHVMAWRFELASR